MIKKRIFKTKLFSKLTNKYEITDCDLSKAVQEIQAGLYEADLGGNVYKKRVAIGNRGKSHGVRTIIATKLNQHWFFIFGFKKNERLNINNVELANLMREISNNSIEVSAKKEERSGYIKSNIIRNKPNITKMKGLGWNPIIDAKVGFTRTIRSMK